MASKNRTVSKNIQRKIKMCDIKNGFKLCTCKGAIPKNTEPSRDCRRPRTLRQYPYEKQTIQGRS